MNAEADSKTAIERTHCGTATLAQTVPVRETFEGKPLWEGIVHVFHLTGHPTALYAYAWSSPIEGSTSVGSSPCCISRQSTARKLRCGRRLLLRQGRSHEVPARAIQSLDGSQRPVDRQLGFVHLG